MPEIYYDPKWKPPKCFVCKNFNGVTGMDLMCKKYKDDCLGRVSKETLRICKKNNWFFKLNE